MRLSRVLLAGTAVAAAGIATSAFTAGNTVEESVAGYGTATVSGVNTSDISYVLNDAKTQVTAINFKVTKNLDDVYLDLDAWLQLKDANGNVGNLVDCTITTFVVGPIAGDADDYTPISCPLPPATAITSFNSIALTVAE
jgi:hypothetical protein